MRLVRISMVPLMVLVFKGGCSREPAAKNETSQDAPRESASAASILFPENLRTTDPEVNDFVSGALQKCAEGNYGAFRALWSAKEEPLPREEFEKGWSAAREIRVLAIEKASLDRKASAEPSGSSQPEMVYAIYVAVMLDPQEQVAQKGPKREAVLMIVREQDQWRLASAPKRMREWIKSRSALNQEQTDPRSEEGR